MKNILISLALLFAGSPALAAQPEIIRCVPGAPSNSKDQISFTEITCSMSWIGNMMQGYFKTEMALFGSSFPSGKEMVTGAGNPHYSEFHISGQGQLGWYLIQTYWNGVDRKVGDTFVGTFSIRDSKGWTKSSEIICTKTE
jgi:hypothetical protein